MVSFLIGLLNVLLVLCSVFLICLVLIQRGRGGGLAGAFGGAGGSSAFGSKAADVFTKITMYTAIVWIALAMILVRLTQRETVSAWGETPGTGTQVAPLTPEFPGAEAVPAAPSRPTEPGELPPRLPVIPTDVGPAEKSPDS